ncbi:hypothetical protein SEVIR_9G218600v4 [Setaria viridis]|uniref:Uncharacterized protein n=2 Tax=Setaria TaxID=4554 RepID=K4ALU8_SETIT|nr:aquaporin PIP2-1 [Setaria italica]XP_034571996.1 aquaporin PIP2-1-like [Setaria viridis]RCV42475.1 hypothetical protein SETIT_9G219400v2 [Setaria italica]TKV93322.1 hypothetical protein SEVIR_9G218600v2 [Setaria viridis]
MAVGHEIVQQQRQRDPEHGGGGESSGKDYTDPPPQPVLTASELRRWSLYRAAIAEFVATLLFLYLTVATVIGYKRQAESDASGCGGVGVLGIAWAFGGMIFLLVYCAAGISGGHINPAVTLALLQARKVSVPRAALYVAAQCLGAVCGAGLVRAIHSPDAFVRLGGGANAVGDGYGRGTGLAAEVVGTFVLVYTVFSATDAKRNARDSHIPVLAPLPIGFAVFVVHLATIPITGTGINPARSFGAAVVYNQARAWQDQWIFWVGPLTGAAMATLYHEHVLRASAIKALGSFKAG